MASDNINERNRKNAQHSTGPRTPEGKARSSRNALVHGMYSRHALLPTEDENEYLAHQSELVADMNPDGPLQEALAHVVSDNLWRMQRVRVLDAQQIAKCIAANLDPDSDQSHTSPDYRSIEALGRHEQRIQNGMQKALKELRQMQQETREKSEQVEHSGQEWDDAVQEEAAKQIRIRRFESIPGTPRYYGYFEGDRLPKDPQTPASQEKNPKE